MLAGQQVLTQGQGELWSSSKPQGVSVLHFTEHCGSTSLGKFLIQALVVLHCPGWRKSGVW